MKAADGVGVEIGRPGANRKTGLRASCRRAAIQVWRKKVFPSPHFASMGVTEGRQRPGAVLFGDAAIAQVGGEEISRGFASSRSSAQTSCRCLVQLFIVHSNAPAMQSAMLWWQQGLRRGASSDCLAAAGARSPRGGSASCSSSTRTNWRRRGRRGRSGEDVLVRRAALTRATASGSPLAACRMVTCISSVSSGCRRGCCAGARRRRMARRAEHRPGDVARRRGEGRPPAHELERKVSNRATGWPGRDRGRRAGGSARFFGVAVG